MAHFACNMRFEADRQFYGVEAALAGFGNLIVDAAHACCGEELLRHIVLDPGCGLQRSRRVALQVRFFDGLRIAHYLPGVAGQIGAMDDQHTDGAQTRGLLIFVGPAAVVGEGLAFEEAVIVRGRLIHDDQKDFALDVYTGIVVPMVFGSINAIAYKNNRRVNVRRFLSALVFGHPVAAVGKGNGLPVCGEELSGGLVFDGVDGVERDFLEVGSVVARRLQPVERELCGDIFGGKLTAALARTASFKQVAGKEAYVGAYLLRVNAFSGPACWFRHSGNSRDLQLAKGSGSREQCDNKDGSQAEKSSHFASQYFLP